MGVRAFFFATVGLSAAFANASDVIIFDSRRPVSLSDDQRAPRDFFINAGTEMGLKPGVLLRVIRRIPMYDSIGARSAGDLVVQVAKIRLIHVQNGLSVARPVEEKNSTKGPALEDPFVMVGDRIDLGSAEADTNADNGSTATTTTVAQNEPEAPQPHEAEPPVPAAAEAPAPSVPAQPEPQGKPVASAAGSSHQSSTSPTQPAVQVPQVR